MSGFTTSYGYLHRYFTRWKTIVKDDGGLQVIGWEVCDRKKFDNIGMFENEDRGVCEAVAKLLNEEDEDGLSK